MAGVPNVENALDLKKITNQLVFQMAGPVSREPSMLTTRRNDCAWGQVYLKLEIYNPLSKVGPFSTDEVYSSRPPKHTSIHIHMNILIYLCFYILYVFYIRQHCPNSLACLPLADVSLAEHLISTLGRGAAWINCSNVILCSDPFLTAR
jgi:hypothetical protein